MLNGDKARGDMAMTGKQISAEQVKVMAVFTGDPQGWFDSGCIERMTGLPGSSVRHFLFEFMKMGLLDRLETHGGYRYRLSPEAEVLPYHRRLQEAAAAMKL